MGKPLILGFTFDSQVMVKIFIIDHELFIESVEDEKIKSKS